ncbi:DUF4031 domain-containing protein [Streptomyces griseoaurantiacus]|uniref:DUF4031 domain-containing protein n=1 Tax=Streptomyces griseoaurantiacus TaxID=68213 RepID=UPI0037AF7582
MTIYVDPPTWPGHGRLWSHLVSDVSYEELHAFAEAMGVPRRAFERDHYDLPSHRYADAVGAGAVQVSSREVVRLLTLAGLRRRKGAVPHARPHLTHPTPHPSSS